uniref:Uncharacterized protein n=1 Tax=Ditylenchus dipsaci TaxID=166011 RepID=A0A915CU26_9BILA
MTHRWAIRRNKTPLSLFKVQVGPRVGLDLLTLCSCAHCETPAPTCSLETKLCTSKVKKTNTLTDNDGGSEKGRN